MIVGGVVDEVLHNVKSRSSDALECHWVSMESRPSPYSNMGPCEMEPVCTDAERHRRGPWPPLPSARVSPPARTYARSGT